MEATSGPGGGSGAHPVSRAVAAVLADLGGVSDRPMWSMTAAETREVLGSIARVGSVVAELEAQLLRHADTVEAYAEPGATSTAAWLGHTTRVTRREAHGKTRLAAALEQHPLTREALARGEVRVEQAQVICRAVDELTRDLETDAASEDPEVRALAADPDLPERAEKHLLAAAEHHDAKVLRILGKRILEVADPARADAHEARALEREEKRAAAKTRFSMADDGHGLSHGRFAIPTTHAAMLRKALLATAAPQHQNAVGGAGTWRLEKPGPQRLGEAFCEYLARYPADKLPHAGGVTATVVVTMTLESLLGGLKAAQLDTGERITAGQARRMACEAGLVPAVLGTRSQVLDQGFRTRLFTDPQRIARIIEQATCEHGTCDVPAAFCHAHHRTPWAHGGTTNKDDLQWLCPRHHTLAHQALAHQAMEKAGKPPHQPPPDPPRRT